MIPVGYVVGGAVLFGIGYVTYELIQAIKTVEKVAENATKPVQDVYAKAQNYAPSASDAALFALGTNPVTAPAVAAYELYEAL